MHMRKFGMHGPTKKCSTSKVTQTRYSRWTFHQTRSNWRRAQVTRQRASGTSPQESSSSVHSSTTVSWWRCDSHGDRVATATENDGDEETAKSIRIYDSGDGLLLVQFDTPFMNGRTMTSLAWTSDGRQLFAASDSQVKQFDTSSGSLLKQWSVPGGGRGGSVVLSRNQKFAVVAHANHCRFGTHLRTSKSGLLSNSQALFGGLPFH